ncbi:ECF-type sigma factor [Montanilutibacter psychrotolerans]|uniref:Sigma-70 family RNA polymerase sigma factor n=1 Tax=Montanilutibacter psychrotolerans TaxID=1327343 RepID=A0A3M8SPR2_9GAMM|nr:ECF-type sigma factor [Lysobacter psychrotolerans]RNF83259.1 sigma-70 family RNA polymerase sigma factor [Lysobacter psychrotolerans]
MDTLPSDAPGLSDQTRDDSVTRLLMQVRAGQASAWDQILPRVYDDLHRVARAQLRQRAFGDVSATALVNEAWLRLAGSSAKAENRRHYIALVAKAMRYVLMDEARRDMAAKHGSGQPKQTLTDDLDIPDEKTLEDLFCLDAALTRLFSIDERLGQLVELRYFGGLDEQEIAALLGVTDRTLRRDWRRARAFLLTQLGDNAILA